MNFLKPDYQFEHFSDISIHFLREQQIKFIFSDLDSTLTAHDQLGDNEFTNWYEQLIANEVTLIVVSNNRQARVDRFTEPYGIKGYGRCKKPTTSVITEIMEKIGASASTSLFLGDQLFTDVICGKRLRMKTALVKPLAEHYEPWTVRWKRGIESKIKKRWQVK